MGNEKDEGHISYAAPGDLLFSLPTICDCMPPLTEKAPHEGETLVLHEDDWRQAELIAIDYRDDIEAMLEKIDGIYEKERTPVGAFRRIYARDRIADPLSLRRLNIDALRARFHYASDYDSLEYEAFDGVVRGGFAWRTGGELLVYGLCEGGLLHTLCLEIMKRGPGLQKDGEIMENFCAAHRLILVDWCFCTALLPGDEGFRAYFSPSGRGYRSIAKRP